jgi:hypothetical protein
LCVVVLLLPTAIPTNAEQVPILECKLDRIETVTPDAKRSQTPILMLNGKPSPITLIIAGLGTPTVTAKSRVYTLALGDRVLPMPAAPGQQEDSNDWFYARSEVGVTVLQIPRTGRPNVEVRLHNLGIAPYTYVGRCQ